MTKAKDVAQVTLRRVAHLDMDAFYASVELLRYPQLRGLPVVIGGQSTTHPEQDKAGNLIYSKLKHYVGRGVVTTSTYEARALGVVSAMGMMRAAKLAPDAIILPADFDSYRHYSTLFKQAVKTVTPEIENRSIDEVYIDLSSNLDESHLIAKRLKETIFNATGLTCSVGIAPNKLLAKLCSELDKPDGITVITDSDIKNRIWPLGVGKINGIGPKAVEKLNSLGIVTIGDLACFGLFTLQNRFGRVYGLWLHQSANGWDDRPVVIHSEPKLISREATFEYDLDVKIDRVKLTEFFYRLCEQLSEDLKHKGYVCYTIGIKIRFTDFHTVTRDITLSQPISDSKAIIQAARVCLRRVFFNNRIRLLGIKATGLLQIDSVTRIQQGVLFD
ncbi:DNA polymerase IV [Chitinimonas sp. BJB300]|uniref:DNA polymerase IV n=1 Tax=Chitinimonas sp. BJB300 TaxID=1559339 RepID=UPI000C103766|nr:DNA polymerase IV [Chitinimonas sp. BJB300]PHV11531.1 DNA polymerase IV [Chitinimonas sp. BJB300]TSJ87239.1 DNA polymerase IV [Chitinimonas sp. BJB300]